MSKILVAAAVSGNFTLYPGFLEPFRNVEAIVDRGLILEVVIRCDATATGILSFSKPERLYCSSKNRCYRELAPAMADTCR